MATQSTDTCPECTKQSGHRMVGNRHTITLQCECGEVWDVERKNIERDAADIQRAWAATSSGWRW